MTMRTAPAASGVNVLPPRALAPTVNTRKNDPISSTAYFWLAVTRWRVTGDSVTSRLAAMSDTRLPSWLDVHARRVPSSGTLDKYRLRSGHQDSRSHGREIGSPGTFVARPDAGGLACVLLPPQRGCGPPIDQGFLQH